MKSTHTPIALSHAFLGNETKSQADRQRSRDTRKIDEVLTTAVNREDIPTGGSDSSEEKANLVSLSTPGTARSLIPQSTSLPPGERHSRDVETGEIIEVQHIEERGASVTTAGRGDFYVPGKGKSLSVSQKR